MSDARDRFALRLDEAGVSTTRFIPVEEGEKGAWMKEHQQPENWLPASSPRLNGGNYGVHPGGTDECERWLVEFDIDDYDGEIERDVLDDLPATFTVESPHTQPDDPGHRYYAVERDAVDALEELAGSLNPEPSWGEIKAKGKYVVGPGSQLDDCTKEWCEECAKPDGGWYRIAEDREIAELTREQLESVLQADPAIDTEDDDTPKASELFGYTDESEDEHNDYDGPELSEAQVEDALDHVDEMLDYSEWWRVGFAVHAWDDEDRGKEVFEEWSQSNEERWNRDPDEGQRIIDVIWNNDTPNGSISVGTLVHYAKQGGWTPPSPSTPPGSSGEDTLDGGWLCPEGLVSMAGLALDEDERPSTAIGELNDRKAAAWTWELVKRSENAHVRVVRENAELWAYDDEQGVWTAEGERALRHAARNALTSINYGKNVGEELEEQARIDETAEISSDDLGLEPGYVAVENGLLDLDDGSITSHSPKDYALTQLPVEYDPEASYEEWQALVDEWAEEGRADALQEYVGYCLHVGALPIHRALLLVGSGANGKGVFLSVVRALLGEENTKSIELQTLANEHDAVADFHGALANIDDDLSSRKLGQGLGMFKKLSAGDSVRGRRLYKEGFEYNATGKQLYAANEVPDVSDDVGEDDEAFWRRWLLIEFPNHYPPSERDPQLSDQLTQPEVLSGVLNWAIEGRRRLLEQGYFTNEALYAQEKRERWQAWGDSVEQFISECVTHDPTANNISTTQAHRRYAAWCRESGVKPIGQQQLTNTLKQEDVDYTTSVRVDGKVKRGYKALGLSDAVPELETTPERQSELT